MLSLFVSISAFAEEPPVKPVKRQPIWVIAHMTNSARAVEWAAEEAGANGVEADLRFNEKGEPAYFQHSEKKLIEPCDCSCGGRADNMEVCKYLGTKPCLSEVSAVQWFAAVVAQSGKLGLVVIDSKVDKDTSPDAGRNLIKTLELELFDKKYNGMVIIGASNSDALSYLNDAATAAAESKYTDRMYFTLDGGGSRTVEVLDMLLSLPSHNIVYGTGITACWGTQFTDAILLGEVNRRAGVIGFNYIWTIDKYQSVGMYLEKGAGGIMTNNPATAVTKVKAMGYVMASPRELTLFPAATNDRIVDTTLKCDCNYGRKGCVIDKNEPAPPNWACKCETTLPRTCTGSVVVCKDPGSKECLDPGTDEASCKQGRGNCEGYR